MIWIKVITLRLIFFKILILCVWREAWMHFMYFWIANVLRRNTKFRCIYFRRIFHWFVVHSKTLNVQAFVRLFVCFVRSNSLQLVSVCPSFSFYLHTHLRIYIFIHDAHRLLHRTAALMITAFWWGSTKYSAIVVACIRLKLFRSGTCQLIKLLIYSFKSIHFTRIIESRFFFFHSLHFYFCLIASCVCVCGVCK